MKNLDMSSHLMTYDFQKMRIFKKGLATGLIAISITCTPMVSLASGGPTTENTRGSEQLTKIAGGQITICDKRLPQGENIYTTSWPLKEDGTFYDFPSYLTPIGIYDTNVSEVESRLVLAIENGMVGEIVVSVPVVAGYGPTLPPQMTWISDSLYEAGMKEPVEGVPNTSYPIYPSHPITVWDTRLNQSYNIDYPMDETGSIYTLPSYLEQMPYQPSLATPVAPSYSKCHLLDTEHYALVKTYYLEDGSLFVDVPDAFELSTRYQTPEKQYVK